MNDILKMNRQELEDVLTGANEKETPALQALVNMMTSPIPKRAGLKLSKEDTAEWAKELNTIIDKLQSILDLTADYSNSPVVMIDKTREIIKELII